MLHNTISGTFKRGSLLIGFLMVLLACTPLLCRADMAPGNNPPEIVVGGDHNYPPYEFLDENQQPAGFNVDLTRAIAEVNGDLRYF